ncbi:hypothetical protein [Roseibium sp.]|uniref:hypothetical protein n=1 Tax=Roseibium sp. TaxID=1936156 RepID=UPI00391BD879
MPVPSVRPDAAFLTDPLKKCGVGKRASNLYWDRLVQVLCVKSENRMLHWPVYTENEKFHLRGNTLLKEMIYESDGFNGVW